MKDKRRMTTTLPDGLASDLEKTADETGITMNTIIEDALRLYRGETDKMIEGRRNLVLQVFIGPKVKRAA